jgi:tetratricopeptide (TPR) repeat protein
MKLYKLAPLTGALLLALLACGCDRLKARDHLNKGVADYRNAQFQLAIMHFKEAVRLDPTLLNARLYLATAYFSQYVPGGESEDNLKVADDAIKAFNSVLNMEPGNTTAISFLALIYFNEKKFDQAKEYQERRLKLEPNNPEPYYWIGLLDWAVCFPRAQTLRKDHNIDLPKDPAHPDLLPVIPEKYRNDLAEKNGPLVDEGIKALQKAIDLKPNYDEAMAYLNLMYRQKAEIDSDDDTRAADLKLADEWVEKSLAAKKAASGGTPSGGQ